MSNKKWYDKMTIKVLLLIAKIMSRYGEKTYCHEIDRLEKEIFESEEN